MREKYESLSLATLKDLAKARGLKGVSALRLSLIHILEYKCDQCGECYLNLTGGICPITACSKSLVNGQCGGSKNGKCEVDSEMECGWERIYSCLLYTSRCV